MRVVRKGNFITVEMDKASLPNRTSRSDSRTPEDGENRRLTIRLNENTWLNSLYSEPCECCGAPEHSLMTLHEDKTPHYRCPIVIPRPNENLTLSDQLLATHLSYELSTTKMAETYGYNKSRLEEALINFVKEGHGSAMSFDQNTAFRNEVFKRCDEVLERWELEKMCVDMDHDLMLESSSRDSSKNRLIFCDLDGVLVDFCEGIKMIFAKPPSEIPANILWSRLAKTPRFYTNLPWMRDGRRLWESIKHLNPTIITTAP